MKKQIELNQLKAYLIFNNVKEKDISLFLDKISLNTYQKNDIIIKEEEEGNSILFLIKGNISISQALTLKTNNYKYQDNREKELIKIDSNDSAFTFGEISLFNKDKRRSATVKANSECLIGKLKFSDLSQICDKNTKIGYQIMKNVGEIITKQLVRSNNNVLKLTTAFGLMIDK